MGIDNWPWKLSADLPNGIPVSLRDLIGRPIRVVAEGHAHTMDFVAGRVTIYLDKNGLAKEISVEKGDQRI